MEASRFVRNWGPDSNTMDNSTVIVAHLGYYQRLMLATDDGMIPPHSDDAQVDNGGNVLQKQDDLQLEQLDNWEPAPELIVNGDPPQQLQFRDPSQELQSPSTSETIPEFPTVDQSEETNESGEQDGFEEEDQSSESDGKCSNDDIDESTGGPALQLPKLASGEGIGVTEHKKNKQWEAHLWARGSYHLRGRKKKGVQLFLGSFNTVDEAKMAHDRAALKLETPSNARGEPYPLNFAAAVHASYMADHAQWTNRDFLWKIRRTSGRFSKGKSSLKGVTVRKRSVKRGQEWVVKYEARLSLVGDDKKHTFSLGSFDSEQEAGQAYDRALLFVNKHRPEVEQLSCVTNFRPSTYSASDIEAQGMASKLPKLE